MNRTSFRANIAQHAKAIVTVVDKPLYASESKARQKWPHCYYASKELKQAKKEILEIRKESYRLNAQVADDLGIEFTIKYAGFTSDDDGGSDKWLVTGIGDFSMVFHTGVGHRVCFWHHHINADLHALITPPSAMTILYCIRNDNTRFETFETWCGEYGYDPDSRKAEKIYNACLQQTMMFMRNYPSVNLDEYEPLENY